MEQNRIKAVDGLRTIAVLGVVWIHTWSFYGNPSLKIAGLDIYKSIAILGNGVDLFFVISGFFMYLAINKKDFNTAVYLQFLKKRWFRIAPAFYTAIAVYGAIAFSKNNAFPIVKEIFFHFVFLNNFTGNSLCGPFWSLGTEWHFYIVLPFLLLVSKKWGVVTTVLVTSFFSFVFFLLVNKGLFSYDLWESQILVRFPEFGWGIIVAWMYTQPNLRFTKKVIGIKSLIIALLVAYCGRFLKFTPILDKFSSIAFILRTLADYTMTFGFAWVLLCIIEKRSWFSIFLENRLFMYIGKISYSIYLWHSLCFSVLIWLNPLPFKASFAVLIGFLVMCFSSITAAHFSYKYLEAPYFNKRKG